MAVDEAHDEIEDGLARQRRAVRKERLEVAGSVALVISAFVIAVSSVSTAIAMQDVAVWTKSLSESIAIRDKLAATPK